MQTRNKEIEELENKMKGKYLTESWLGEILKVLYPNCEWIHDKKFQTEEATYNFKPDYCCHELQMCVEFDGPDHFTKANVVQADIRKDKILKELGYEVIRIPYFIQMDSIGIKFLFGLDIDFDYGFSHGFISKNVMLPANFCEQGVWRFKNILFQLSEQAQCIFDQIQHSLFEKVEAYSSKLPEEVAILTVVPSKAHLTLGLEESSSENIHSAQGMIRNTSIIKSTLQNNWNCVLLESSQIVMDQEAYDMSYTYGTDGNLSGYSFKMLKGSEAHKFTLLVEKDLEDDDLVNVYGYVDEEIACKGCVEASEINVFNILDFLFS